MGHYCEGKHYVVWTRPNRLSSLAIFRREGGRGEGEGRGAGGCLEGAVVVVRSSRCSMLVLARDETPAGGDLSAASEACSAAAAAWEGSRSGLASWLQGAAPENRGGGRGWSSYGIQRLH